MGCCSSQSSVNQSANPSRARRGGPQNTQSRGRQGGQDGGSSGQLRITYLQNPKVEKILPQYVAGHGIKKTPAYETPLTMQELMRWRQEFWETRTAGSQQVWELLKTCCEEVDESTGKALIEASDLTMPQNSLTTIIDSQRHYYRIPIACINDPLNFSVDAAMDRMQSKKAPEEKLYNNLKIRSSNGDMVLQVKNTVSVKELKQIFVEKIDNACKVQDLRFFCMGQELKNDLFLYSYEINDEMIVQAMIKPTQK